MGLFNLYEKLSASPEPLTSTSSSSSSRRRQRLATTTTTATRTKLKTTPNSSSTSRAATAPAEPLVLPQVLAELQSQAAAISASQKGFIECIVNVTNTRVSAQRLCYHLDSEMYNFYNNPGSREQLKLARLQVQDWIRDVQQKILSFDRCICNSLPPVVAFGYRKRQKPSSYEAKRVKYLRLLRSLVAEFVAILMQQRVDLKEVCGDYCHFITEQYHSGKFCFYFQFSLI